MIRWGRQGKAVIGGVSLRGGGSAQAVILGPRVKPKSISIIVSAGDGKDPVTRSLDSIYDAIDPRHLIELRCMQERIHGPGVLPAPPENG